jgi:organic radical activating enzyme
MSDKTYKYSETFFSAQGEGKYIGVPSLWIRFFLCNLQCNGFGQEHPTKPETWDLPYEKIDITDITRVEDLPVFEKGCDSSYTWAKKYKHLMHDKSASDICDELEALLPGGKFKHPQTGVETHMVFTGGEPMLKNNQAAIMAILEEFKSRDNYPKFVTVETNGTTMLTDDFYDYIRSNFSKDRLSYPGTEWYWSISPKLWSTAGETAKKAIKPGVVRQYWNASNHGQLKFVVNGTIESWDEVEYNIDSFKEYGSWFDPWVMGVGGTFEGLVRTEADIADEALQRGYNYSSRVHVHIYGNAIGK